MNPFPQKLLQYLRSIKLSDTERAALRTTLIAHMRESSARRAIPSPWTWSLYIKPAQVAFLSLLIVVGYGSSMTLAADAALPGDILYHVKTRLNEPIARLVTVTSPATEAKFETLLLEKRLEEAETLDTREKLGPELTHSVREVIREQSSKAKKKIKDAEDMSGVQILSVATSTVHVATSSSESSFEKVLEKKQSKRGGDNVVDIEKGKNKRALKAVLEKHGRILEKLDLDSEKGDTEEGE